MLRDIERRIALAARGAGRTFGLTVMACLLLFAGLAFLSFAGWIWLEGAIGALYATLILGVANLLAGGIIFALARPASERDRWRAPARLPGHGSANGPGSAPGTADATVPAMVQAFMAGFQAGAGRPAPGRDNGRDPGPERDDRSV